MYTSDLQLSAEGLRRIDDLPQRAGFEFIGRTRDGRDIECEVLHLDPANGSVWFSLPRGGDALADMDLVGWKFRPAQNDFA